MARARPSSPVDPLDRLVGAAPALQTLRAHIRHLIQFDAVRQAAVSTVIAKGPLSMVENSPPPGDEARGGSGVLESPGLLVCPKASGVAPDLDHDPVMP